MRRFKTCGICNKLFTEDKIEKVRINYLKTQACHKCIEEAELRSKEKLTPQEEIKLLLKDNEVRANKK